MNDSLGARKKRELCAKSLSVAGAVEAEPVQAQRLLEAVKPVFQRITLVTNALVLTSTDEVREIASQRVRIRQHFQDRVQRSL